MSATAAAGPFGFSDEARRMSDYINQAIVDGHRDKWMAFRMDTCESDGVTYDSRGEAVKYHRMKYSHYMYIQIPWDQCTARAAEVNIMIYRQLQKVGNHPDDPEVANDQYMMDNRREAYPSLDRRRILMDTRVSDRASSQRRSPGGLILP